MLPSEGSGISELVFRGMFQQGGDREGTTRNWVSVSLGYGLLWPPV